MQTPDWINPFYSATHADNWLQANCQQCSLCQEKPNEIDFGKSDFHENECKIYKEIMFHCFSGEITLATAQKIGYENGELSGVCQKKAKKSDLPQLF